MYKHLLLLLLGTGACAQKLSAEELSKKLEAEPQVQLVDVRTPSEFKAGHIPNASNIDVRSPQFNSMVATLDKSKPVYIYCLSGGRSSSAANKLREMGFQEVIEMPGGMMEWRNKSLPEEKLIVKSEGLSLEEYRHMIPTNLPVLIDFYADWCAPCKKMKPYIEAIEKEGKVKVIRIDADQNPRLMKELNIVGLPVIKLQKGDKTWEHVGFVSEMDLRAQIAEITK
ncbi:Rhodanese domain protein [Leadbetterella byssophila DSM 17132]|jgi:thioredoxin 1|uniref:Rhodanese domain protein n=1 Tax=Leadbetterella byssophila (strain DSM 17132 / JCM 16389 / KACC 11308 / NBRC 106382 / 4M15) TaxID=649349 RepID=E4RSP9_LEAB4|nr:rhodanese-like domain-containing protein [Leadbetterella byssophila]ADQ15899.1 Rhodanese domain protein [Leadbetterella byssophila DSM 17132]